MIVRAANQVALGNPQRESIIQNKTTKQNKNELLLFDNALTLARTKPTCIDEWI